METILKDACYRELQLAVEACNDYTPLTMMQYYIEAEEDPKIAEVKEKNEKAKTNAFGHIKKAIETIRKAIGSLLSKIADAFSKASMEKETREAYEKYKAAVKEHPELANKKITATDFKKSEEVYKKILKETEEADKKLVAGQHVNVPEVIKKCESYAVEMGKGVATSVGAQYLINLARSNQGLASFISYGLNSDLGVLEKIEDQIGSKNAEDLNNEVAKLTQRCTLYRFRLKMHNRMYSGPLSAFKGAINGLKEAALPTTKISKKIEKATKGDTKNMDKFLRGNEATARVMNMRDSAIKTGAKEYARDRVDDIVSTPARAIAGAAERRREAKGDYSGADIGTYVQHNIDKLKNKKK